MNSCFACPVCQMPLSRGEKTYTCQGGHSFDIAKGGYVNLLRQQNTHGHGDNREMILARHLFLERGWYQPLLDTLCQTLSPVFVSGGVLLDAGCGEGWYTEGICRHLMGEGKTVKAYGIDISKEALKLMTKRPLSKAGHIELAVGSVYKMPFLPDSADVVLNLFAPLVPDVYHSILHKDGYFIMAVPDERHLWELKEVLYDTPYLNRVENPEIKGFRLVSEQVVVANMPFTSGEDLLHLFSMTPYAFRTSETGKARLKALDALTVTAAFRVFLYQRIEKQ